MGMLTSSRSRGKKYRPVAEINVTPFVDVMLVLLIIFMVTAPLLAVGVPVDLPKTKASQISADEPPLVISVQNSGKIFLQEMEIAPDQIIPRLVAIQNANPNLRIFVRGDRLVAYGEIIELMGRIQSAGFERVALVAQLPQ